MHANGVFRETSKVVFDTFEIIDTDDDFSEISGVAICRKMSQDASRVYALVGCSKGHVEMVDVTASTDVNFATASQCPGSSRSSPTQNRKQHPAPMTCTLAIGNGAFTGHVDGAVLFWKLDGTFTVVDLLHSGSINGLSFDAATATLYTVSSDGTLRARDLKESAGKLVYNFGCEVNSCDCFPYQDCVICGLENGSVVLVKPSMGTLIKEWKGHKDVITSIQKCILFPCDLVSCETWQSRVVSAIGGAGVTSEVKEAIEVIPCKNLRCKIAEALENEGTAVKLELTRGFPNTVQVTIENDKCRSVQQGQWGPKSEEEAAKVQGKPQPAFLTASLDGTAKLWTPSSGTCVATTSVTSQMFCVVPVAGGRSFVTGSADGVIRRWNMLTGVLEHEYKGHSKTVSGLAQDEESGCLISCSLDRTVRVWSPLTECEFCPTKCAPGEGCCRHKAQGDTADTAQSVTHERPGAPSALSCEVDAVSGAVHLKWKASSDDKCASAKTITYVVQYHKDRRVVHDQEGETAGSINVGSGTECLLRAGEDVPDRRQTLIAGQPYRFTVIAVNHHGSSLATDVQVATPQLPKSLPSAPLKLEAFKDHDTLKIKGLHHNAHVDEAIVCLQWSPPEHDGRSPVLEYHVTVMQRDANAEKESLGWKKTIVVGKAEAGLPYVDLGLGMAQQSEGLHDFQIGGKGQIPPALNVSVKLISDPVYQYFFTVEAVTAIGVGPKAELIGFGPVKTMPAQGLANSTKSTKAKPGVALTKRSSSSSALAKKESSSSGNTNKGVLPKVAQVAEITCKSHTEAVKSVSAASKASLPRLPEGSRPRYW